MSFAVVRSGGKQYIVSVGKKVKIEKIPGTVGEEVHFADVLLVAEGKKTAVGAPTVSGAKVIGRIVAQGKRAKQVVFKMKPKKRYRVKRGHRQPYTEVEITEIKR